MYNNPYNRYKEARNAAWQVLIDNEIKELPVPLTQIAKNNGITIVKNREANMLPAGVSGMSILENGKWYIVYNDKENPGRRRFTIAHEMGHIFLGHELKGAHQRTFACLNTSSTASGPPSPQGEGSRQQEEIDADSFAVRLLSPACVLWGMGLHSPEEIAKVCGLSRTAAEHRAKRMEVLYERNKFLSSPLERKVWENFKDYIRQDRY
ncbi:MAG: ImmA/IrrE family metallo-endopeptidase [Clostridia bacterium]